MTTNIYLQSDFVEDYDRYLHNPMGEIRWKRLSRGGRNRREIFGLLEKYINLFRFTHSSIIPHGTVRELYHKYKEREIDGIWNASWDHMGIQSPFNELVIYQDEMAHRGEGKIVVDIEEALKEYPDLYASVLLKDKQNFIISYRDLYIGNRGYQLTYVSLTDDWRSNCGHTIILYNGHSKAFESDIWPFAKDLEIQTPIFALDYIEIPVMHGNDDWDLPEKFYVDFNESPGIPEEVVVKDYMDKRYGELIPFHEIISDEKIAKCIEKALKVINSYNGKDN